MNNDIAIFLDLDNIVIGAMEMNLAFDVSIILNAVRELTNGRVVLRRAYGDWRQAKNMPKQLATAGFELQSAVRLSHSSKNLADMQLVVDAMETLVDGHNFSTYVIVTGDRDFLPLVQTLRKRGKRVVGIGLKHTTSQSLIDLCDEYIFYEDVARRQGQQPFDRVEDLLRQALEDVLAQQSRIQASLLKERMQELSQGSFGQSPQGKKSFRKFLAQFPHLVQMLQEGTTLYVARPQADLSAPPPEPEVTGRRLPEATVRDLLVQALAQLLEGQQKVRASLLKERLKELSQGVFDEEQQGDESFRQFLSRYPDLVAIQQSGTTLYAAYPEPVPTPEDLFLRYRSSLKKKGLRVVPPEIRLPVLRDLIDYLQKHAETRWKQVADDLASRYQPPECELSVSKSHIHDVIRLARRAEVIRQSGNQRSLAATQLSLALTEEKLFQEAVMRCDGAYLAAIEALPEPFDMEQVALALYEEASYARYLRVVHNRFSSNGNH